MEHFTTNVSEEDDLEYGSRSKEYNDLDIEAILERSRNGSYRRTRVFYEAPEFVRRLEAFVEVTAGSTVTFHCQWKACPRPHIKWFKDDEEITDDHPYFTLESDDDGTVRLILAELTKDDEGAYKCKAENQEGVASTTGYLSVTGDNSDKTLNAQQKSSKSKEPNNSPTSPNISLAPHLCTILEQQSLEEREAEAQRRLPPSPLQEYIETVQKTKTWPLAKMGYNPGDFATHLDIPNGYPTAPEDNEDAQSTGSDTSVDSQPDTTASKVTTTVQSRGNTIKSVAKVTRHEDHTRSESQEKEEHEEPEDTDLEDKKPVCTVSVQMRSESGLSRLTKIRQDEARRLSLVLDSGENKDEDIAESPEQETPKASAQQRLENGQVLEAAIEQRQGKEISVSKLKEETRHKAKEVESQSNNLSNGKMTGSTLPTVHSGEPPVLVQEVFSERNTTSSDNPQEESESLDSLKTNRATQKRHLAHQKSKERRSIKKQKSLVEITIEWLFQKLTGKVGEQLELPWIYYFAFTVFCGCFCAAIRLNPFYMIIVVAVASLVSFRFILSEEVVQDTNETSEDGEH